MITLGTSPCSGRGYVYTTAAALSRQIIVNDELPKRKEYWMGSNKSRYVIVSPCAVDGFEKENNYNSKKKTIIGFLYIIIYACLRTSSSSLSSSSWDVCHACVSLQKISDAETPSTRSLYLPACTTVVGRLARFVIIQKCHSGLRLFSTAGTNPMKSYMWSSLKLSNPTVPDACSVHVR